jgi:hypothetical protein
MTISIGVTVIASAAKQSTLFSFARQDGLLRLARNDGEGGLPLPFMIDV